MSKPMGRPRVLEGTQVRVRTTVPSDVDAAIESLARMTGVSKFTIIRQALLTGLQPYAVVNPDLAAALIATSKPKPKE